MKPVATHEIDKISSLCQQDSRTTGAKIGRRTECEAMVRHQLFKRVLTPLTRGCQWFNKLKQQAGRTGDDKRNPLRYVRKRSASQMTRIIISRAVSIKNTRSRRTRVLGLDISLAFWRALLPQVHQSLP